MHLHVIEFSKDNFFTIAIYVPTKAPLSVLFFGPRALREA